MGLVNCALIYFDLGGNKIDFNDDWKSLMIRKINERASKINKQMKD